MEYKKFDNMIVLRMNAGEEILETLKTVAEKENIKLAMVNALGATNDFTIGVYSVKDKKYYQKDYKGDFEIVSLHGNVTTMNGETYLHLHMSAGNKDELVGGHLNRAVISATCEMLITVINGNIDRIKDEKIGINILKF